MHACMSACMITASQVKFPQHLLWPGVWLTTFDPLKSLLLDAPHFCWWDVGKGTGQ